MVGVQIVALRAHVVTRCNSTVITWSSPSQSAKGASGSADNLLGMYLSSFSAKTPNWQLVLWCRQLVLLVHHKKIRTCSPAALTAPHTIEPNTGPSIPMTGSL